MDANVTIQVEAGPFEAMAVYFDEVGENLYTGQHLNEIAKHDPFDPADSLVGLRSVCRPATPEETLAYWAAVAVQVESERKDFESRIAEMTGHYVNVQISIHPPTLGDFSLFEATRSVDGYEHQKREGSQWLLSGQLTRGHVAIFGPCAPEQSE